MAPYTHPKDAVWFITGCSSGIGLALTTYLLAHHPTNRVVATARNPSASPGLSSLPSSPNLLVLPLDVTSDSSVQTALATTLAAFSRIDVVINNAGFGLMGDTESIDIASPSSPARQIMETNFWGAVRVSQHAVRIFREENPKAPGGSKGGLLLQVTSMGGRLAFAGNAFYHASKFALEGFTEALSKEMHPDWNIHFLLVEPGGVKTRYAETATASFADDANRLAAYKDPSLATNVILKYKESPAATKAWADVDKVAEVLGGFVVRGGELGLRLPLGADAWGMMKKAMDEGPKELERLKEVAWSVSGEEQLDSVKFLLE